MALQDVDIILKAKIDIPITSMASVELNDVDNPTIVFMSGGGKIQIDDWQTDFAPTIVRNLVSLTCNIKIDGNWFDYSGMVPEITRSIDGKYLLTVLWIFNISGTIEQIEASIF